jgi:hypothetical protein
VIGCSITVHYAERLQAQLDGKAVSVAEQKKGLWEKAKGMVGYVVNLVVGIFRLIIGLL